MILNNERYYTHIKHFPQEEIKKAVQLLEEASILWELYDQTEGMPHYLFAQSKAVEAGHLIFNWSIKAKVSNPNDAMSDVIYSYAPKKDYRLIEHAWNGIGGWLA